MNDKFDARNCVGGCNPMKGLANRYRLTDHFDKALEKCRNQKKLLSVEILDVDCFKEYNDNYGHQAGDECIQAIDLRKQELGFSARGR